MDIEISSIHTVWCVVILDIKVRDHLEEVGNPIGR